MLSDCEFPCYIFSGIKKRSYIDNAKHHIGCKYMYKIDISAFFPNISREKVYNFFWKEMKMSEDVANILTNFCTINIAESNENVIKFIKEKKIKHFNHLPTGVLLSYLVNISMFDNIYEITKMNAIKMSLYVDDLTFSSDKDICVKTRKNILRIIKNYGYNISKHKIEYYALKDEKIVTGVIVNKDTILVTKELKAKIVSLYNSGKCADWHKLLGMINAARQIEPNIFNKMHKKVSKILNEIKN